MKAKHWMEDLKQSRDELKLKVRLFKAEAKENLERVETQWQKLESEWSPEIREGFNKVKKSL